MEADLASYEILSSKSELTINTIQSNNNELMQRIVELESEIKFEIRYYLIKNWNLKY